MLRQVTVVRAVTTVAGAGLGIALAPVLAPAVVGALGFSAGGVVAGKSFMSTSLKLPTQWLDIEHLLFTITLRANQALLPLVCRPALEMSLRVLYSRAPKVLELEVRFPRSVISLLVVSPVLLGGSVAVAEIDLIVVSMFSSQWHTDQG